MRLRLHSTHFILGGLYLPPGSQSALYGYHVGSVMDIFQDFSDDKHCIFGDFNLPHTVWLSERNLTCFKKPGVSLVESNAIDLIRESCSFCGSAQVNTIFNSKDTMLDLIFVNDFAVTVDNAIDSLITPDVYHPPLLVSLNYFALSGD